MNRPLVMESKAGRVVAILLLTATVGSFALAALRIGCFLFVGSPTLIYSTGCECESLFTVWKFTQGQPVFADSHQIPFAATHFNWAYYLAYGWVAALGLALFHLGSEWLPTVCRLFTLLLGVGGFGLFFAAAGEILGLKPAQPFPRLLAWCGAGAIVTLADNFIFSTRPDAGAVMLELAGLMFFLRYLRDPRWPWLMGAAGVLYLAWAFKQTSVSMLAGTSLMLLLSRRWRPLLAYAGGWLFLVAVTLAGGGGIYRQSLIFAELHCRISPRDAVNHLYLALGHDIFLLVPFFAHACFAWRNPREFFSRTPPAEMTVLLASYSAFFLAMATVGKAGADFNYFIPVAFWSMLWLLALVARMPARFWYWLVPTAAAVLLVGVVLRTADVIQTIPDLFAQERALETLRARLPGLPGPAIIFTGDWNHDSTGNLPWIQPRPPYFVLSYSYYFDKQAGVPHERGGWEGLAREGYFSTVVMDKDITIKLPPMYRSIPVDDPWHVYYGR